MKNWQDFIQVIIQSNSQQIDFKKIKFSEPTVCDNPHDSYNCGIYVVHYINSVIRNKSDSEFIPNDYRESLKSKNMEVYF